MSDQNPSGNKTDQPVPQDQGALWLVAQRVWSRKLSCLNPSGLLPIPLAKDWQRHHSSVQSFSRWFFQRLLSSDIDLRWDERDANDVLYAWLALDDLPDDWLLCYLAGFSPLTPITGTLRDLDGVILDAQAIAQEFAALKGNKKLRALAWSALRFVPCHRYRILAVLSELGPPTLDPYNRNEPFLLARSYQPLVHPDGALGRSFLGELIGREDRCYFIADSKNMLLHLSEDFHLLLTRQKLGRARGRLTREGLILDWIELGAQPVAPSAFYLLDSP